MAIVNYSSTITATTTSLPTLTFNSSGAGSLTLNKEVLKWYTYENDMLPEYVTFDNTSAKTITYNNVGASPVGGSLNLTVVGDLVKPATFIVTNTNVLGTTASSTIDLDEIRGYAGSNTIKNNTFTVRKSIGSDWTTTALHNSIGIDNLYLTPGTDTRCFWERNPYNETHTFGSSGNTILTISKLGIAVAAGVAGNTNTIALAGTASGANSTTIGYNSAGNGSLATATSSMSLGGSYASGVDSFAAATMNITSTYGAQNANSIAIGQNAKASGNPSIAIGQNAAATGDMSIAIGWNNTSGNRSYIIGGTGCTAGDNSVCLGSWNSTISNAYSTAVGGGKASDNGIQNKWVFSILAAPVNGGAQSGKFVLYRATTDATPTALLTNSDGVVNGGNQITLPNQSCHAFSALIVARQSSSQGTASAAWKIEGLVRREASAATTVLVSSNMTILSNAPSWTVAVTADTTVGCLTFTVTGAAATNIRWVATVTTSEVIYS